MAEASMGSQVGLFGKPGQRERDVVFLSGMKRRPGRRPVVLDGKTLGYGRGTRERRRNEHRARRVNERIEVRKGREPNPRFTRERLD